MTRLAQNPLVKRLNQLYQQQSARDQRMLVILAISLGLALIWFGMITPMQNYRLAQQQYRQQAESQYQWLLNNADTVKSLLSSHQNNANVSEQNLSGIISASARQHGIGVSRLASGDGQAVRLSLNNAEFDQVVVWLGKLAIEEGIRVASIQLNNPNQQGRADISLDLVANSN